MKDTHSDLRRARASETLSKNGYVKSVADREVRRGIGEHENAEHGGKKTKLKLKDGGEAKGKAPKSRLDRKARASGGRLKGHKDAKVKINIINAGGDKSPMPPPGAMGAAPHAPMPMPPPQAPAAPPMGGAGAPPPMGGGMPPRPMPGAMPQRPFKGGGPVRDKGMSEHITGGAGGGRARLEKSAHVKSEEKKRK